MPASHDLVLVVDYGAQYAQLIARRVREAHVYSEIVPHAMSVDEMVAKKPTAIILSGGPASVYVPDAPKVDPALFSTGIPVFGICYGFQLMAVLWAAPSSTPEPPSTGAPAWPLTTPACCCTTLTTSPACG